MKREDKLLVVRDLKMRMGFPIIVSTFLGDARVIGVDGEDNFHLHALTGNFIDEVGEDWFTVNSFEPYYRPLESMTKEEMREIDSYYGLAPFNLINDWKPNYETLEWLNEKGFDYRGLIKRGLGRKAKPGMY